MLIPHIRYAIKDNGENFKVKVISEALVNNDVNIIFFLEKNANNDVSNVADIAMAAKEEIVSHFAMLGIAGGYIDSKVESAQEDLQEEKFSFYKKHYPSADGWEHYKIKTSFERYKRCLQCVEYK